MKKAFFEYNGYNRKNLTRICAFCFVLGLSIIVSQVSAKSTSFSSDRGRIENSIIVTQIPLTKSKSYQLTSIVKEQCESLANWSLRLDIYEGARLVKVNSDSSVEILSKGFHSACDPEISFDASLILFAGKKAQREHWKIFEMGIDGSNLRQVTNEDIPCRSPGYQSTLYTIVSPKPWQQLTFVGLENGYTNLYSCKLDGSSVRRLTFNLSDNMDPFLMYDGRLLFASLQHPSPASGVAGSISLFGIGIDGTDYAAFSSEEGKRIKHMSCTTTKGLVVFIESDKLHWDGAGNIGSVRIRRPLHSYRRITRESNGFFHSPSPLPDGKVLISRRSAKSTDSHGVYSFEPSTGQLELIFDSPDYHDVQAKVIRRRREPDGRSSVVTEKDPNGKLYCLDVYISDFDKPEWIPVGTVKRLRVLEGISTIDNNPGDDTLNSSGNIEFYCHKSSQVQQRILGEIDITDDGSFNIEIPANTPIKLQILDADGMALRSCDWIWAKNHEPRGCIGCHEDGELTPENVLVKAVTNPSIKLTLPAKQRRTIDFRRDVMPIIEKKCIQCHDQSNNSLVLTSKKLFSSFYSDRKTFSRMSYDSFLDVEEQTGERKYVYPGSARKSPLIWHIFGRNTSRPWDNTFSDQKVAHMPPDDKQACTKDEKRTFVEWIDMGALWDGIPGPDNLPEYRSNIGGGGK